MRTTPTGSLFASRFWAFAEEDPEAFRDCVADFLEKLADAAPLSSPAVESAGSAAPGSGASAGDKPFKWPTRAMIYSAIDTERYRQDRKWGGVPGVDRRDDHTYAAVLTEEVGEVCKAWLERDVRNLRTELIQVAAVAIAWLEELDNGGMVPRA